MSRVDESLSQSNEVDRLERGEIGSELQKSTPENISMWLILFDTAWVSDIPFVLKSQLKGKAFSLVKSKVGSQKRANTKQAALIGVSASKEDGDTSVW